MTDRWWKRFIRSSEDVILTGQALHFSHENVDESARRPTTGFVCEAGVTPSTIPAEQLERRHACQSPLAFMRPRLAMAPGCSWCMCRRSTLDI
jgi:hypothetical protein